MSSFMPLWLFITGIIVLASMVTALQLLRRRYKPVVLASNQFWAAALQRAPARQLSNKLRHFWAWLLVLLIVLLTWLMFAGINNSTSKPHKIIFYLDASAYMLEQGRFNEAKDALLTKLHDLPETSRQVLLANANPEGTTTILAPGDSSMLLERRLGDIQFTPQPSSLDEWLKLQAKNAAESQDKVEIYLFGGPALADLSTSLTSLPDNLHVYQQAAYQVKDSNIGIVSVAQYAAESGNQAHRDVYFRVAGNYAIDNIPAINVSTNSQTQVLPTPTAQADGQFVLSDLAADGQTVTIAISANDALEADNKVSIQLTDSSDISVGLSPSTPEWLRSIVKFTPKLEEFGETSSRGKPDVQIIPSEGVSNFSSAIPSLILTTEDRIVVHYVPEVDDLEHLKILFAQIDNSVPTLFELSANRSVQIPAAWFAESDNTPRTLPVVVVRLLNWLAGTSCDDSTPLLAREGLSNCSITTIENKIASLSRRADALNDPWPGLLDISVTQFRSSRSNTNSVMQAPSEKTLANNVAEESNSVLNWLNEHLMHIVLLVILALLTVEWLVLRRNLIP